MTVKAQIKWTDGMQFIARAGKGPAVVLDSSEGGSGPSPMEMVLIGVAGCSAIDVIMIMEKKRAQVTDFQVLGTRMLRRVVRWSGKIQLTRRLISVDYFLPAA